MIQLRLLLERPHRSIDELKVIHISNKAEYTATKVACGWAGALYEGIRPSGQEQ